MNEIGPVLGMIGAIAAFVVGGYVGLIRYIDAMKDREHERRMSESEARAARAESRLEALGERLRVDELATEKLKGDVAVQAQKLEHVDDGLDEMRANQVPRQEFERQVQHILTEIRALAQRLERSPNSPGRYGSGSSDPNQKAMR